MAEIASRDGLYGSDENLLKRIDEGDKTAFSEIVSKYKGSVGALAKTRSMPGAERDDVIQEGMIGLVKAVRSYSKSGGASFATYANVCISNQIKTAVKAAARAKHLPLNNYLSIDGLSPGEGDTGDFLRSGAATPEETVIGHESLQQLQQVIYRGLSNFERQVLALYIEGMSFADIAASLSKPVKSVDNAVCRFKKKLKDISALKS